MKKILKICSLISIIISLGLNFWALDRGYISSDEAWYMYLFDNNVIETGSHGHMLFSWISGLKDIYLNRLFVFILKAATALLFGLGFNLYLRRRLAIDSSLLIILGLIAMPMMYIVGCPSVNYTQLLHVVAMASLGTLFFALVYNRWWLYALAGIVMSLLFPVKVTSMLLVPFALIAVYLLSPKAPWRNVMWSLAGGIFGILAYILIFESLSQIQEWITSSISSVQRSEYHQYQSISLVMWLVRMCICMGKWAFIAFIIVAMRHYMCAIHWVSTWLRDIVFVIASVAVIMYMHMFAYPFAPDLRLNIILKVMIWVVVFVSMFYGWTYYRHSRNYWVMMALLMLTPGCISFGTNIPFMLHHIPLYVSVLLITAICQPGTKGSGFSLTTLALFIIAYIGVLFTPLNNWHNEYYTDQRIPLTTLGFDERIKVNQAHIDRLQFFKTHLPQNAKVITATDNWSVVELMELDPLSTDFRQNSLQYIQSLITPVISQGTPVYILLNASDYTDTNWGEIIDTLSEQYDTTKTTDGKHMVVKSEKRRVKNEE